MMINQSIMKRCVALLLLLCISLLSGCGQKMVEIRNTDDGKLRISEQYEIDFYLGNDEVGASRITEQCLSIIGERKPDSVETNLISVDFNGPDDYYEIYKINGAKIILLHFQTTQGQHTVLTAVMLDANHVLESGIRIGSTEEELKRAYEDKPEFYFESHDAEDDDNTRFYVLYGDWFERYLILFEVNATTGKIVSISYELDI